MIERILALEQVPQSEQQLHLLHIEGFCPRDLRQALFQYLAPQSERFFDSPFRTPKTAHDTVQWFIELAGNVETVVSVGGDVRSQWLAIACSPEMGDGFNIRNQLRIALDVAEFAEKMAERILELSNLVDTSGDLPQLSLCADVAEVDRKELQQVLRLVVNGTYVATQES